MWTDGLLGSHMILQGEHKWVWGGRNVRLNFTPAFRIPIPKSNYRGCFCADAINEQADGETDRSSRPGRCKMAAEGNYDINEKWKERPARWWGRRIERYAGRSYRQAVLKSEWVQNVRSNTPECELEQIFGKSVEITASLHWISVHQVDWCSIFSRSSEYTRPPRFFEIRL